MGKLVNADGTETGGLGPATRACLRYHQTAASFWWWEMIDWMVPEARMLELGPEYEQELEY